MPIIGYLCLVLTALIVSTGGASSGDGAAPEVKRAMAGTWLVAPENGSPGCWVTLRTDAVIGGSGLDLGKDCAGTVPRIGEAVAWRLTEDGLVLADGTRKALVLFLEAEDATYATAAGEPPRLHLVKAAEGVLALPRREDMFGPWFVTETGNRHLCLLSLLDEPPPGGEGAFAIVPASQNCDPAIKSMKLFAWRVEGLAVLLYGSDGDSLAFEPDGKGAFVEAGSATETARPRRLVRPRK